ncbi:MAG: adaptor protein MecA [Oscillospiraceae bacterium]|jgi:negative regulator of genetic competence, sporulation and motility|nr:adaptor protein MecA [Oscillospiraceae bacterium]
MILEQITKEKLLMVFSQEDIQKFDVVYGKSKYSGNNMLKVIREVLFLARIKTGFNLQNDRLMIEFIRKNKNCYVMATILGKPDKRRAKTYRIKQKAKKCIFIFNNIEDLFCAIERLYSIRTDIISSQLLKQKSNYTMIIGARTLEIKKILPILSEYGKLLEGNEIDVVRYIEFGENIIRERAVQTIGKQLANKNSNPSLI